MKPKTKFSKYEKGGKTQDPPAKKKRDYTYLLNPRNWTVENLGEEPSFNQAFKKARKMGLTEFLYNGRRYNTQSNESPKTQFNKFGNTNELLNADLSPETKRNLLMIEDSFYRSGDVLPERYERGGRGQYLNDLLKLHERAGNPSIDLSNGRMKGNIFVDDYRSSYRPMFNSMQLSWPIHYFGELAHAVQDEDANLPDIQGLFFDTPARAFTDVYELPGTKEYEAHKVIEPRLKFRMDYHAKPWTPSYDTLKFTNGDPRRWAGGYPDWDEEPFTKEDSAYVEEGNRLKALDKADSTDRAEKMKMINRMRFAGGGKISIKPENRGKFTAWAENHNMGVQQAASHIMANKGSYSPTLVKRANFARNAAGWKKQNGGALTDPNKPSYTQENLNAARDIKQMLASPPPDYSRTPWENPDRQWWGGDTGLGKGENLYIDDAGNLKPKPQRAFNPLANLGLVQRPMVAADKLSTSNMINLIRLRSSDTGRFNDFVDNYNAQTQRNMNYLPPAEGYNTFVRRTVPPTR